MIAYSVNVRIVTVECAVACKVGYLKDGAYIAIPALTASDGYTFTVPKDVDEVLLTLKGDTNLNGKITALDIALINAHMKGKLIIGDDMLFAGDVDCDGVITDTDIALVKANCLGRAIFDW